MGPPCHYLMDSQADLHMSTPSEYLVSINYWLSLFEKSVIWSITYFIGSYLVKYALYIKSSAYLIQADTQYLMSNSWVIVRMSLDMLTMHMIYCLAFPNNIYTMYSLVDVHWHTLIDIMS